MKAFSLLELLVAMAVGSLVTGLTLVTLMGGLNVSSHLRGEQEVAARGELLIARLQADVQESDLSQAISQADSLCLPLARDAKGTFQTDGATGLPVWASSRRYLVENGRLYVQTFAGMSPEVAAKHLGDAPKVELAHAVRDFRFSITSVNVTDPVKLTPVPVPCLLTISGLLQYQDRRGGWAGHSFERQFFARNSFSGIRKDILPDLDDPPPAALNLPEIEARPASARLTGSKSKAPSAWQPVTPPSLPGTPGLLK